MTKNYTHPLRAIREAHNLTIDELAEEVKVGAKTIWNAENNRPISAKCRRLICAYFGKTSQELELISAKRGGKIEQPLKTEFSVNLTAEYVPEVPLQDLRGRSLSFSPHIILDSSLLDRLAHTFNAPGKMDNATLGYLSTLVFEQKKQLVQGKGTNWYELLTTASNNLRLFMNFLESCPGTRQQLISIIGETCLLIGDVLFNAGDYQTAISYYTMSLHAAQESQNTTLQAIAFGRYCLLLIDHQQSSQALPFIDKAIRLAESDSSSVIRSWLWAVKGEAYASTREEKKCFKALETSMELLGRNEDWNDISGVRDLDEQILLSRQLL